MSSTYKGSDKRLQRLFSNEVEANPSGSVTSGRLNKLRIGNDIYKTSSNSLEDLTDVNISDPEDGEMLVYDSHMDAWVNAGGGRSLLYYSTSEAVAGTWYGGKTLYQQGFHVEPQSQVSSYAVDLPSGASECVKVEALVKTGGGYWMTAPCSDIECYYDGDDACVYVYSSSGILEAYVTLWYIHQSI